jgi:hypothetical protein
MAEPFLNWLVDIMLESSPSRRPIFAALLRGVNPAQMRAIIAQFLCLSAGYRRGRTAWSPTNFIVY